VVLAPVELPVGIVTALAGGPVFVWLLIRTRRGAAL
jgi:ABC-type Fe3+-siderophore transport system permease subunit